MRKGQWWDQTREESRQMGLPLPLTIPIPARNELGSRKQLLSESCIPPGIPVEREETKDGSVSWRGGTMRL